MLLQLLRIHNARHTRLLYILFITALLIGGQPVPGARAAAIIVNSSNDNKTAGDGECTLREAITNANNNSDTTSGDCASGDSGVDTITFDPAINEIPIVLSGAAGEDINASGDLDTLDGGDLTIQGNGEGNTIIEGGGIDRIFHICPAGCGNTVTLIDMTVQHGSATNGGGINNNGTLNVQSSTIGGDPFYGTGNTATLGGGIYNNGTLTIQSSSVGGPTGPLGNSADYGAGIYNTAGTLTIQDSTKVWSNTAANLGGGIYNLTGTLTVNGSTITGNKAAEGGGIYTWEESVLNIQNGSTIGGGSGNTATNDGGGIYNEGGAVTVDASTVSANTAFNGGGIYNNNPFDPLNIQNGSTIGGTGAGNTAHYGGGIYNRRGTTTVESSSVIDNDASSHGSGIYNWEDGTLYVQNGSIISENGLSSEGGGICNRGTTTIDGSTVSDNDAVHGAGIFNHSTLLIQNASTIGGSGLGNTAGAGGGGICNFSGTTTVDGSTVSANSAVDGGGIYNYASLIIQNGSTIGGAGAGNQVSNDGGGIYNYPVSATTTVTGSTISDNTADSDSDNNGEGGGIYNEAGVNIQDGSMIGGTGAGNSAFKGGGIHNESGTTTIGGSTVSNNDALAGGGIYNDATLNIDKSTIRTNEGTNYGGGIYSNGTLTIDNSTISGNFTEYNGGGIYNLGGTTTLNHITITDNTADSDSDTNGDGGGIYNDGSATVNFRNTLIAGNFDNPGTGSEDCFINSGTFFSLDYNLAGIGTGCPFVGANDQTTADAILLPLADNGGSTETHALDAGSPALNQIPTGINGCGTNYAEDQRGISRPQGTHCDIGAYEKIVENTVGFYAPDTKIWRMRTGNTWSDSVNYLIWGPSGGGWTPVIGDWDNDGIDEVGFYDPVTKIWRMRTGNTWTDSVNYLVWGPNGGGWTPVTGDWDNDGVDEVGFYDPATKI
ncbi:MAG: choice-of-anchor Q domain-containing protein [Anaerolineales bacterium]